MDEIKRLVVGVQVMKLMEDFNEVDFFATIFTVMDFYTEKNGTADDRVKELLCLYLAKRKEVQADVEKEMEEEQ